MKLAFLYAGQGTQHPGMGQDLYETYPAFRQVLDSAQLDFDLKELCFEGPEEKLSQTQYTQPCMVAFAAGVTAVLREAGCDVQSGAESIRLRRDGPLQGVRPVRTAPYPGFPTDAQAPLMAALTRGKGCTVFVENIFESRYRHVDELSRMGADIRVEGRVAVVYGVPRLHGAQVRATDLRGGAALAVAALGAEGRSELTGVHHIDRGYQSLEGDLRRLGAEIRRI